MPHESDEYPTDKDKQRLCGERCLDLARDMIQQMLFAPTRYDGIQGDVVFQDEVYHYQFVFQKKPVTNDDDNDTPTNIKSNPDPSPPA